MVKVIIFHQPRFLSPWQGGRTMNRQKQRLNRILAMLLTLILCLGLVPSDVLAWVGPIINPDPPVSVSIISQDGWKVGQIKNDYMTFEIDARSPGGVYCRTVPTKYYSGSLKNAVNSTGIYQELTFGVKARKGGVETKLTPTSINMHKEGNTLACDYTFNDKTVTCTVLFSFYEAQEGRFRGQYQAPVTAASYQEEFGEDVHGKTWLVQADAFFNSTSSTPREAQLFLTNHRMPYFGHESEKKPRKIMVSSGSLYEGTRTASVMDISHGISETYPGDATEVGTVSYDEANPFVVLNVSYDLGAGPYGLFDGVEGQGVIAPGGAAGFSYLPPVTSSFFPNMPSSAGDILVLYPSTANSFICTMDNKGIASQLWGFRNVYKAGETVVPLNEGGVTIDSEFEDADTNAAMLAIIPDSKSSTGYKVKELKATDTVPSDAVTVFRGTFTWLSREGYYDFGSGNTLLSPTISANYNVTTGGYFRLKPDGTIMYRGISLSVPTFCFYKSKNSGNEPKFSYDKKKGLVIELDPDNNSAYTKVDIPYAKSAIEKAVVDVKGNIIFSGELRIQTIFDSAKFQLSQLSLGNDKKGKFTLNGLEAELDIQNVNLFGLGIDKAYGKINTMTDYYHFTVSVDAFKLFQFAADLELMRTSDGTLMPNTLYGELNVPAQGLPLIPPVPVYEITGGGIGFSDLVKTLDGDYIAIPPVKIKLATYLKMLKVVQGKVTLEAGPSGIQVSGRNLSIPDAKGLKLVDELEMHFYDEGMVRTYNHENYTGINLKGGMSVKVSILTSKSGSKGGSASSTAKASGDEGEDSTTEGQANSNGTDNKGRNWGNVLTVTGGMDLSMFGGLNNKKTKLYLLVDTTGTAKAELNLPEFIPVIGGLTVGEAGVIVCVGAQTLVSLDGTTAEAFSSAIKNLNGYVGVCAEANVLKVYGRVYYVSPRTIGAKIYWGEPDKFNVHDYVHGNAKSTAAKAAALYDENGEQVGIAILEDGLEERDITVNAPEDTPEASSDENAADAGDTVLTEDDGTQDADAEDADAEDEGAEETDDEDASGLTMTASRGGAGKLQLMANVNEEPDVTEDPDPAEEADETVDSGDIISDDTDAAAEAAVEEGAEEDAEEPDEETGSDAAVEEGTEEGAGEDAASAEAEEAPEAEAEGHSASVDPAAAEENTLKVALKEGETLGANDTVILEITPSEGVTATKEEFLKGLKIDNVDAKEIIVGTDGENTNGGNVLVKVDGETGAVVSADIFLDNTKTEWTIYSDVYLASNPRLFISNPDLYEKLENVSYSEDKLTMTAANLNADTHYELHTYMGTEPDSGEYAVGEPFVINDGSTSKEYSVDVPTEGESAETGDYYLSTALVKIVTGDFNGDGEITDDEVSQVALDRWVSNSTIHYTNTNTPAAPAAAAIEAGGNETLLCTFGEVTDADGYIVRIYKDGEDTGYGYEFAVKTDTDPETGKVVKTLEGAGTSGAVEYKDGKYTLRVAPTVGGTQLSDEGKPLPQEDQPELLAPGSGYTLGVSAFRYVDQTEKEYPLYSTETLSNAAEITAYEEADFTVKLNGNTVPLDDNGMYQGSVSPSAGRDVEVSVESAGDYTISLTSETNEEDTPFTISADGAVLSGELDAFDGCRVYDIVVTNKNTKDRTTAFLQVIYDDVAPALLLDADTVIADKDGKYSISGTTEAGVEVNGTKADNDGRFAISGVFEEELGVLEEKMISYESTFSDVETLAAEEEFNELVSYFQMEMDSGRLLSYSIVPETYTGPGEYALTVVSKDYIGYSDDLLQQYQEMEKAGQVSNVTVFWEKTELSASDVAWYKEYLNPDTMKLTTYIQPANGVQQVEVKAVDASGNETKAAVTVSAHIHKMKEVPAVPGSCTQTGTISYFECEECGRKFADAAGLYPAPDDLSTPKQPNSHSYGGWKQTKAPTALAEGENTRTCTRCGHKETRAVAKLPAKISLSVGNIKVDKTTVPLKKKQKFAKITAAMTSGDRVTEAKSNKEKVVKASVSGSKIVLKALKKTGRATVTVKTAAGAVTTFKVKVQSKKVTAKKIVGFKKKLTLKKGKKYKIPKDVSPVSTPDKMKFKSTKPKFATVSKTGVITAKKKGKTVIVVTIGKKKFKCTVTVK